jgi:hypothetical protein
MRKNVSLVLWVSLAVVLILGVGILVGFPIWMRGVLSGPGFRQLIAEKTGAALHATAIYSPLTWQGSSAFADSLEIEGTPGSFVKNLHADQIRAEVNWREIWNGVWRVDRIDVTHLVGEFGTRTDSDSGLAPAATSSTLKLPSFLPKRFELGELNLVQTQLTFQGGKDGIPLVLDNARLLAKPDGAGWTVEGNGGTLTLPMLPKFRVVSFRSRLQEQVFFLTDAKFRLGPNGELTAAGEFAEASKLRIEWSRLDVAAILDEKWRTRLSGRFDGAANLDWPSAGPAAGTAKGTFVVTEGVLQNLPMLDKVASFTGARQFRHMPIQEFSGTYHWSGGALKATDLVLESKGLMRVEGNCDLAPDGRLTGTLRIGVTPQTLQWLPGSRERVFTVSENGYLWTPLQLGGTLQNPKEDLSARLAAAMKDEVIDQGRKALEVLPGPAKKGAQGLLDALAPLLR